MKKIISILLFILFTSGWTIAQIRVESEWKIFSGSDGEFTIDAPINFQLSVVDDKEKDTAKNYFATANGISFAVWTAKDAKSSNFEAFLTFIQSNQAQGTDKVIGSFKSKTFNFVDTEGYYHQMSLIETDSRFFIFHLFSEKLDQAMFNKFFNSIKLNPALTQKKPFSISIGSTQNKTNHRIQPKAQVAQTPKINKNPTKQKKSVDEPLMTAGPGTGRGEGSGTGRGSGIGNGVGSGNSGKPADNNPPEKDAIKPPTRLTKPLYLLSKPRASYTDIARLYQIQGTVKLRVTFLANGTIGTITQITKLPFGLTDSSFNAARQMRFEPAQKNGVPYTVVKQVEYTFTIY